MDRLDRESWLDAELRRVTPPAGLVARLQKLPVADDDDLDALLRETPLPPGLIARLKRIPFRAAPRERRWRRVERQAVAATLAFSVWFAYAAALILFWLDYRPPDISLANWLQTESPLDEEQPQAEHYEAVALASSDSATAKTGMAPAWSPAPPQEIEDEFSPTWPESGGELLALSFTRSPFSRSPGDTVDLLEISRRVVDEASAETPAGPHFDRKFLWQTGVLPRVEAQHHPISRVPLSTEAFSFELARKYLQRGRFPPADEIRLEEFLAAVDYGLPQPQQPGLALTAAAGRTPWRVRGDAADRPLCLVQFNVQAGPQAEGSLAAANARLSVRFNPRVVADYRVCGHDPSDSSGKPADAGLDLPPGGSATAVYELQLRAPPGAGNEEAATATLQWNDPVSGAACTRRCTLRRDQIVPQADRLPARLQLAALATAAGELLRNSPYAASISPAAMLELARQGESQPGHAREFRKLAEIFARIQAIGQRSHDALRPPRTI